ncbi:MAG: ATP-binding protein [Azospirillum brasilense]|nr:MAG: ATP-binding protein [Azospirillum brasilense]
MYHPYFRGKQYELITIRETAKLMAHSNFVPIIEPVKEALSGLERTLHSVCAENGQAVVIVNPHHGEHSLDGLNISHMLKTTFLKYPNIHAGVLLKESTSIKDALSCCDAHKDHKLTLVHAGFTEAKALVEGLGETLPSTRNVFLESGSRKLYRKYFEGSTRILLRDGFERRRNRDHPSLEPFSDIHITFSDEGMDGFGDFLTVGDDFFESGGPAYAIAIHLTFIDPEKDDEMFIYHFVSDRQDTPTDPAGKFAEALSKLMKQLDKPKSKILETSAVTEFRHLHARRHFPGLGYVKKLSMKHHIETIAKYFDV